MILLAGCSNFFRFSIVNFSYVVILELAPLLPIAKLKIFTSILAFTTVSIGPFGLLGQDFTFSTRDV